MIKQDKKSKISIPKSKNAYYQLVMHKGFGAERDSRRLGFARRRRTNIKRAKNIIFNIKKIIYSIIICIFLVIINKSSGRASNSSITFRYFAPFTNKLKLTHEKINLYLLFILYDTGFECTNHPLCKSQRHRC